MYKIFLFLIIAIIYMPSYAQAETNGNEEEMSTVEKEVITEEMVTVGNAVTTEDRKVKSKDLSQFGFGPAFFVISYNKEVLKDSKDVRVRGDGAIDSSGSEYSTAIGLEVHYDFSFPKTQYGYYNESGGVDWDPTSGYTISPFLGLYDLDNGINGLAFGVLFGYWRGDINYKNKSALNVGLGYTIHKDQLVLASGVSKGSAPPAGLEPVDYTSREDVEGVIIMVSATMGF